MSTSNGTPALPPSLRDRLAVAVEAFVANVTTMRRDSLRGLFDPRRDVEEECGYPRLSEAINPEEYQQLYERDPIAARVVEVYPKECWQVQPQVYEIEEGDEATAFEAAWDDLGRQLRSTGMPSYYQDEAGSPIWKDLKDLDILCGVGHYGAGLFGLDDGLRLSEPAQPRAGQRLLFFQPFPEHQAVVTKWETDPRNPRYGQPVLYNVTLIDPREDVHGAGLSVGTQAVHWTRLLHVADTWHQTTSSKVYAPPRMRPVWNNLLGHHKISAADPEAFWKNCLMKFFLETHPQLAGDVEVDRAALRDELEPFMNGLEQYFALLGMTAKPMAPVMVDPTPHTTGQIKAICVKLACPVPVFEGYEIGEQASTNNATDWWNRLRGRCNDFITPCIVSPFIDRLIWFSVLPQPSGYSIWWPDRATQSDAEKATVAATKTTALAAYVGGQVESLIPPHDYLTRIVGMDDEEAESILGTATEAIGEGVETEALPEPPPEEEPAPTQEQVEETAQVAAQQAVGNAETRLRQEWEAERVSRESEAQTLQATVNALAEEVRRLREERERVANERRLTMPELLGFMEGRS